ncbi:hypothetical protein L2E82_09808 [Cichorium intybus]|uniref:Uncharacterized protein n=1 Tax=Cichorium intybus TaxID=13427 RepID=A0ACB9G9A9_CICIN|nr:hypothetical protein L2E82_09808 [Cichorium intybus]
MALEIKFPKYLGIDTASLPSPLLSSKIFQGVPLAIDPPPTQWMTWWINQPFIGPFLSRDSHPDLLVLPRLHPEDPSVVVDSEDQSSSSSAPSSSSPGSTTSSSQSSASSSSTDSTPSISLTDVVQHQPLILQDEPHMGFFGTDEVLQDQGGSNCQLRTTPTACAIPSLVHTIA